MPKKEQFNLGTSWLVHTKEGTEALIAEASCQGTKKDHKVFWTNSHYISLLLVFMYTEHLNIFYRTLFFVFFATWFCIFSALVLNPLHALEQGEFGKHLAMPSKVSA